MRARIRRLVRRGRRFALLITRERVLFLAALVLLPVARMTLSLAGLRGARAFFGRLAGRDSLRRRHAALEDRERLSLSTFQMVRAASRFVVCRADCLPQALVTRCLLQRQGLQPELRLGARKYLGKFQAHAWLQVGSTVLDGDRPDTFAPFVSGS